MVKNLKKPDLVARQKPPFYTTKQWRSTKSVIEWFKAIKNKSKSSLIKFDIVDFYPSIS